MLLKIIAIIVKLLIKFGLKKKAEVDASKIDSLGKTVESVNESLEVESEVREKHNEIEKTPTDVKTEDGGLNFDDFNKGE